MNGVCRNRARNGKINEKLSFFGSLFCEHLKQNVAAENFSEKQKCKT